eukprot:3874569-Amphidinium_carterae.2
MNYSFEEKDIGREQLTGNGDSLCRHPGTGICNTTRTWCNCWFSGFSISLEISAPEVAEVIAPIEGCLPDSSEQKNRTLKLRLAQVPERNSPPKSLFAKADLTNHMEMSGSA